MKSKINLILLYFLIVQVSAGQEISKPDIVKFKIKSITAIDGDGNVKYTNFYDEKGNFIKQGLLNNLKQILVNRELIYNDASQLIEERMYNSSGDINTISKYYYNDKSQLFKKENIQFKEVSATWTYNYDEKGNKITDTQNSATMGNSVTAYSYDKNYLLIQEVKSNNSIGKEERIDYKYNDKGQIIEKKRTAYYFNTTITLTFSYSDAGKLTKLIEKSSNGVSSTTVYEYNDKGLLISEIWESSISKTPQKTTYQISF